MNSAVRVGLIGAGIQRSQSPALHMDEGRALGLDYRYEILDLDQTPRGAEALPRLLEQTQGEGFAGLNITYPCKQSVIPLLDELSHDAESLQSVNTVLFRDGRRIGHNTDWWGFAENFRRGMAAAARDRVVLVGAGGAGAAVGYAALQLGTRELTIIDVAVQCAAALAQRLGLLFPQCTVVANDDSVTSLVARADGLIHASPTGMLKLPGMPVPAASLRPPLWVAEVVYVPLETQLLRVARASGCSTLDGGGMAVFQAVMAFELFSGVKPDAERMLTRFDRQLRSLPERPDHRLHDRNVAFNGYAANSIFHAPDAVQRAFDNGVRQRVCDDNPVIPNYNVMHPDPLPRHLKICLKSYLPGWRSRLSA